MNSVRWGETKGTTVVGGTQTHTNSRILTKNQSPRCNMVQRVPRTKSRTPRSGCFIHANLEERGMCREISKCNMHFLAELGPCLLAADGYYFPFPQDQYFGRVPPLLGDLMIPKSTGDAGQLFSILYDDG